MSTHPALEILRISKNLAEVGDLVLGEPEPFDPDSLSFEVKTDHGERYTGIDSYGETVEEGAAFASRHGITLDEGLQAALLYRRFPADVVALTDLRTAQAGAEAERLRHPPP